MREIKFRAWDEKWSRWILPEDISLYGSDWYFDKRSENGGDIIETASIEEVELEQYTGLKDKNGKDLDWWEGDLFSVGQILYKIVCDKGCFWFEGVRHKQRFACYSGATYIDKEEKIGTIHDKPELS